MPAPSYGPFNRADEEDPGRDRRKEGRALAKRVAALLTMQRVAGAAASPLGFQRLLNAVLCEVGQVISSSVRVVYLRDEQRPVLYGAAAQGVLSGGDLPLGLTYAGKVAERGRPLYVPDVTEDPEYHEWAKVITPLRLLSRIYAPLKVEDRTLGVIALYNWPAHGFSRADLSLLCMVAGPLAAGVANARLCREIERAAMLEERDRLARDLHDTVAQTLGSLMADTGLVDSLLAKGETRRARDELARLRSALHVTATEIRELMDGLRARVGEDEGFLTGLARYVQEFQVKTGIHTEFVVTGEPLMTSPFAALQVQCIVQEALANVRKHARASHAEVRLEYETDAREARLIITDDGLGFDLNEIGESGRVRYGFKTMQERAERIGGLLQVASDPGFGTTITVRITM